MTSNSRLQRLLDFLDDCPLLDVCDYSEVGDASGKYLNDYCLVLHGMTRGTLGASSFRMRMNILQFCDNLHISCNVFHSTGIVLPSQFTVIMGLSMWYGLWIALIYITSCLYKYQYLYICVTKNAIGCSKMWYCILNKCATEEECDQIYT